MGSTTATARGAIAGIFVGGRASRMHGVAKGLLAAPDGSPIVLRTRRILEDLGVSCVLVGAHPAYAELGLETLADDPAAEGPLAGLLALLAHAGPRHALAVACDMPLLTREIVRRLLDAPPAPVVAPRHACAVRDRDATVTGGARAARLLWEPLFARYDAPVVLPIARAFAKRGGKRLQLLLDEAGAEPLPLGTSEEETLTDWDAPDDLPQAGARGTRET
jgi:molybdopterin-guanine dinucleotide biosynthesis protein A